MSRPYGTICACRAGIFCITGILLSINLHVNGEHMGRHYGSSGKSGSGLFYVFVIIAMLFYGYRKMR